MCAIIGVVGSIPEQSKVEMARDTMTHRGPDDAGIFYAPEERVALGHRRLSVVDLSPAGHQPMWNADDMLAIVFNGEIYNYPALREELDGQYPFRTKSDTEVILAAYQTWGEKCVDHLDGMFAFAIWDRKEKRLFGARDRLGIKPFFYAKTSDGLCFASEIKGILALSDMPRKLNVKGVSDYFSYRQVLGEDTLFQGIKTLLPGHTLTLDQSGNVHIVQYWKLPVVADKNDPGKDAVLGRVEELLLETTRSHLMSDVPVGAYLSGGLDSSVLAAVMSRLVPDKVKTFSVGFKEENYNELRHAKHVANEIGTDHHEYILHADEYMSRIPEAIQFKDAPLSIPNEIPLLFLSREMKKIVTVALSGEGADELFGGYGRIFRSGYDWERMQQPINEELKVNLQKKYGANQPNSLMNFFLEQYTYLPLEQKSRLLNKELFSQSDMLRQSFFSPMFASASALSPSEQFMYVFENVHLLVPLQRLDAMAMASSVEARVPFVDHHMVEYVSSLPLQYKMAWKSTLDEAATRVLNSDQISEVHDTTKYALRTVAKTYLPASILERKKIGFPVPLTEWFTGMFRSYARDMLLSGNAMSHGLYDRRYLAAWLDSAGNGHPLFGFHVWMMINLEQWMRMYRVSLSL